MIAKATDDELTNQLDDYLKTTSDSKQDESDWTFDEEKGVYVIHSRRLVMYQLENQWICGDYDSFYTDRYLFDSTLQAWYDTLTEEYSVFDESTQTYVPIDHGGDAGQPLSNQYLLLCGMRHPRPEYRRLGFAGSFAFSDLSCLARSQFSAGRGSEA